MLSQTNLIRVQRVFLTSLVLSVICFAVYIVLTGHNLQPVNTIWLFVNIGLPFAIPGWINVFSFPFWFTNVTFTTSLFFDKGKTLKDWPLGVLFVVAVLSFFAYLLGGVISGLISVILFSITGLIVVASITRVWPAIKWVFNV